MNLCYPILVIAVIAIVGVAFAGAALLWGLF
jgi:hypothetical protein